MPATLRLNVAYDGSHFHGWQRMPGVATIQEHLERALGTVLRVPVVVNAAGRTDAGVHACGQVCSVALAGPLDALALRRALRGTNALLPDGIAVTALSHRPEGWHARFSAIGKRYVYRVFDAPFPPVFTPTTRWHVPRRLDVESMQRAALCLVGDHDFEAFRAAGCQARHARRYLWRACVTRHDDDVVVELRGNAFVRSQVRVTVGTLVEVGLGKRPEADVRAILEGRDRTRAGRTAPPSGLFLDRVYYAEDAAEADIPPGATWPGWPPDPGAPRRHAPPPDHDDDE
ncbi:MAG: tRNA pseudouridine(38-40) synthase TruA [Deltaproteobacteria bacterium]|nr:tRNA pseudouridine(38-40) synthase TruA [Deltaproteobacteria bacterium]